jgi:hypothetical protein
MISEELMNKFKTITVFDLVKSIFDMGYPIVTRKLLIIYQDLPNDSVTAVTSKAAKNIISPAQSEGWTIEELGGNNATKQNVTNKINTYNPDFILHYGHSCNHDNWCGQNNNTSEITIGLDANNLNLLSGRTTCTVSCFTAQNMGPDAIQAGTIAYLGYSNYFTVCVAKNPNNVPAYVKNYIDNVNDDIIIAANEPMINLLRGETYATAFQKGIDMWDQKWLKYSTNLDPTPAAIMLDNKKSLTLNLSANTNAVARPFGLFVKIA